MADLRKQSGVRGPTQGQYNKPSVSFPTPETGEYIVVERKTVDSKEQPIAYGTAHPTLADAKLIKQSFELEEDGKKTRLRIYAKRGATTVQNAYNFALQFAADSNAHRVLIRSYLLPAPVTALAKGTADSVISTCILTKEEHAPRGGEDNHHIQVTRIYEELPGPWIPFTRYDDDLGPIQGRRRAVVNTNQAATQTATASTTFESRDGSNYVVWQVEESWSSDASTYPVKVRDFYDETRGAVQEERKVVVKTGNEVGSVTNAGGIITETSFEPHLNANLLYRTITTYAIASVPVRDRDTYDPQRGPVQQRSFLILRTGSEAGSITESSGVITETSFQPINDVVLDYTAETYALPGPTRDQDSYDPERGPVKRSAQLILVTGSEEGSVVDNAGTITETSFQQVNALATERTVQTWETPSPILETDTYDEMRGAVRQISQLVVATGSEVGTIANNAGTITETSFEPLNETILRRVQRIYYVPGPTQTQDSYDDTRGATQTVSQLIAATGSEVGTFTHNAGVITQTEFTPVNNLVLRRSTTTFSVPGPETESTTYDEARGVVERKQQLVFNTGSLSGSLTNNLGIITQVSYTPVNEVLSTKTTETYVIANAPERQDSLPDESRGTVTRKRKLVLNTNQVGQHTATSSLATSTTYQAVNELILDRVTETYALPTPVIDRDAYDESRGSTQVRERIIQKTGSEVAAVANNAGIITELAFDAVNDAVCRERATTYAIASTPDRDTDTYDDQRGAVQVRSRLIAKAGTEVGTFVISGGIVTQTEFQPVNDVVVNRSVQTWAIPGPIQTADSYDEARGSVTRATQLVEATGSEVGEITEAAGIVTEISFEPINDKVLRKTTLVYDITAAPVRQDSLPDDSRGTVTRARNLVLNSGQEGEHTATATLATSTTYQAINELASEKTTEVYVLPTPTRTRRAFDDTRGNVLISEQIIQRTGSEASSFINSGGTITETSFETINEAVIQRRITTYVIASAPVRDEDSYDPTRGAVQRRSQIVARSGSEAGSITHNTGTITEISFRPLNDVVLDRVTETFSVPGPALDDLIYDDDRGAIARTRQLVYFAGTETPSIAEDSGIITRISFDQQTEVTAIKTTEVYAIPSPEQDATQYDDRLGPVSVTRRIVEKTGSEEASISHSGGTVTQTEHQPINEVAVFERVTTYEVPGPIRKTTSYDPMRGNVQAESQTIFDTGSLSASLTETGGVVTQIEYRPLNSVVTEKTVETYAVPGPTFTQDTHDDARGAIQQTSRIIKATGSEAGSITHNAGVITETSYQPVNSIILREVVQTFAVPGPQRRDSLHDPSRGAVSRTRQLVHNTGSLNASLVNNAGTITEISFNIINSVLAERITEEYVIANAPTIDTDTYDDQRGAVQVRTQLLAATGSEVGALTISGGIVTETSFRQINAAAVERSVQTWAIPGPIFTQDVYDDARGAVQRATQLVESTGAEVGSIDEDTNIITEISYEPVNEKVLRKITTTFDISAAPARIDSIADDTRGTVTRTRTLVLYAGEDGEDTSTSTLATSTRYQAVNELISEEIIEEYTLPTPNKDRDGYDDLRGATQMRERIIQRTGSEAATFTNNTGTITETTYEAINEAVVLERITTYAIASVPIRDEDAYDNQRGPVQRRSVLVARTGSEAGSFSISGSNVTEISFRPLNDVVLDQVTETFSLPGPIVTSGSHDDARGSIYVTSQLIAATGSEYGSLVNGGSIVTETIYEPVNELITKEITRSYYLSGTPDRESYIYEAERGKVKQTRKIVGSAADATLAISGTTVTEISYSPVNGVVWDRITEVWQTGEHNLVSQRWDDSIRQLVTITTSIVPNSNNPILTGGSKNVPDYYLDIQETPLSKVAKRRTIVSVATVPSSFTEYKTDQFTFPSILETLTVNEANVGFGIVVTGTLDSQRKYEPGINTVTKVAAQIRPSISVPTVHKIDTSFHVNTSIPDPSATYTISPNNLYHNGPLINFNFGQVLMDAISSITVEAGEDDAQFAGLTETVTFGASAPSKTAYLADVTADEWKIIASEVKHYRGNIHVKINISVKLK